VTVRQRELPTNYILGYFAAPPTAHEDYPALQAALEILSDRLFEEVRTRRNLSYAVSSGISDRRNVTGYLYVTAADANTTIQVMYETIDGMIDPGVDEQDLEDQIEGYLTRYYRGLQSNAAQAGMLGRWALIGGGRENADIHVERLGAVTADDIARVLSMYVTKIQFAIVGDIEAVDVPVFADR
jgi:zinc protease